MRLVLSSVLLGSVWFVASNVIASLIAWAVGRSVVKRETVIGAARLLTLRLLPAASSLVFTLFVFLPAHLAFEPAESNESFGVILAVLASVGLAMLGAAAARAIKAYIAGRRFAALIDRGGNQSGSDVCEVRGFSGVSLAGIWRPRILIGAEARAALTPAELDLAVSHEDAHRQSLDNLKRFLIFTAPDLFGWTAVARELEARWQAEAECEADACAAGGDGHRAALLASALVKVARLACGTNIRPASPAWSAFHAPTLLELRIRHLVSGSLRQPVATRTLAWSTALALGIPAGLWLIEFSHTLHLVTEAMVTHLP
jgi:hypothetical protein